MEGPTLRDPAREGGSRPERRLPQPHLPRPRLGGLSRTQAAGRAAAAAAEVTGKPTVHAPADPTVAAFFDVDNTMIMGASLYYFARGLAARRFFTASDVARMVARQIHFRLVGSESTTGMAQARDSALAFVAGRPVEEVVNYCEEIYDDLISQRIWPGTRALAQGHLDRGQRVWLVTATPVELANILSRRLRLTGALGTVSEVRGGVYTGRLVGEPLHGPAKAEAIRALAEREGLDLSRCTAYSDSINDVPMLSAVGNPVAVNPDPDLRAFARQQGWPIRDFRTGRKVVKVGLPAAAGGGAVAGAVVAAVLARRRALQPPPPPPPPRSRWGTVLRAARRLGGPVLNVPAPVRASVRGRRVTVG